jgi:nitrite reductase/ring-hydroxylating ferredoxin subunit
MIKTKTTIPFCFIVVALACTSDLADDPIPFVPFPDIVINLSLPAYSALQVVNGFTALNNGGVKGIVAYRASLNTVLAYERTCSFQPADACATINVHPSGLYMIDVCCNSTFEFSNGNPTGGPAFRPLRQYKTLLSGNTLTITDDTLN